MIEVKVPDIGDFADVPIIEVLVSARRRGGGRGPADHAGVRQGDDGRPRPGGGQGHRAEGRRGRHGVRGLADPGARGGLDRRGRPQGPGRGDPGRGGGACRAAAFGDPRGRRTRPGRRARRGSGRLHRGVPGRRPRARGGAGRARREARRSVPERRLHSVQGAAARRARPRRGRGAGRVGRRIRRAVARPRQDPRLEGVGRRQAHRRARRARQGAQGARGARRRQVHRAERDHRPHRRRRHDGRVRALHRRGRLEPRVAAVPARRRAHHGLDGRARSGRRAGAAAGDRRRHHRPRDGDGLRRARLQGDGGRAARPAHPGLRPRPREAPAQAHLGALRGDPPRHVRDRRGGEEGRPRGHVR